MQRVFYQYLKNLMIAAYFLVFMIGLARATAALSLPVGANTWQVSEWLINYQGGFVRRGLAGEILFFSSQIMSIPPQVIAVFISLVAYVFVLHTILRSQILQNNVLVFSPLALGSAIYSEYLIRKDFLIAASVVILARMYFTRSTSMLNWILIQCLCTAIILTHEAAFFIICAVILASRLDLRAKDRLQYKSKLFLEALKYFSVPSLVMLVTMVNKGDLHIARGILASLNELYANTFTSYCCYERLPGAINALAWDSERAQNKVSSLWMDGDVLQVRNFLWVGFAGAQYYVYRRLLTSDADKTTFTTTLITVFCCALPLFFVATDYGRWLNLIFVSALILTIQKTNTLKAATEGRPMLLTNERPVSLQNIALCWLTALPGCCLTWLNIYESNPIGATFKNIREALVFLS